MRFIPHQLVDEDTTLADSSDFSGGKSFIIGKMKKRWTMWYSVEKATDKSIRASALLSGPSAASY